MENGRCKLHGGMSLKGLAASNYQGKGHSRYMPPVFKDAFDEALADPDLLDLSKDVATQEAVIVDLLRSLEKGEAPTRLVGRIRDHWRLFWEATGREDQQAVASYRESIGTMLGQAATVANTIDRIMAAQEAKRKLVDTEDKRQERRRNYITQDQARFHYMSLALAVKNAAEEHIDDDKLRRKLLNSISEEFIRIAGRPALTGPATTD